MVLRDVIAPHGRIFLKSEWGPISDEWPAVSFTRSAVGNRLRRDFRPDTDVILYVGTGNPETTKESRHRKRLLSAVKIEPNAIYETRQLIPSESWAHAQQNYKGRWEYSMAVRHAWDFVDLPLAPEVIPHTYRKLGTIPALGNVVEIDPLERDAVLDYALMPVTLQLQTAGTSFDAKRAAINVDESVKRAIGRMVANIRQRVQASGSASLRINPVRYSESDLHIVLSKLWEDQGGRCALCGGDVELESDNKLLECSPDRIDSSVPWYRTDNLQITHSACNLAKNDASMADFSEWLAVIHNAVVDGAEG